jgi:hypothetical protein
MFILSIASAADAALTWSVDEVTVGIGETVVVQLISDSDQPYTSVWVGAGPSPVAEITGITALPGAADGCAVVLLSYPGWWLVEAIDVHPPFDITPGPHFDVTIKGLSLGTYTVSSDFFNTVGPNDTLLINVPEPMTVALLGLGGLFLLRRRK